MPITLFDHDWTAIPLTSSDAAGATTDAGQDGKCTDVLGSSCRVATNGLIHGLLLSPVVGDPPIVFWANAHEVARPTSEARSDVTYTLDLPGDYDESVKRMGLFRWVEAEQSAYHYTSEWSCNAGQAEFKLNGIVATIHHCTDNLYVDEYDFSPRHRWEIALAQVDPQTNTIRVAVYDFDGASPSVAMPMFQSVDTVTGTLAGLQRPGTFALLTAATGDHQF